MPRSTVYRNEAQNYPRNAIHIEQIALPNIVWLIAGR